MVSLFTLLTFALSVSGLAIKPEQKRSDNRVVKLDFNVDRKPPPLTLAKRDPPGAALNNSRDVRYLMDIYFGSNKQKVQVDIDTGSSDLWVHDQVYGQSWEGTFNYSESDSFSFINSTFHIYYNDGTQAIGQYGLDTVSLDSGLTLNNFEFAVVSNATNSWTPAIFGISRKVQEVSQKKYDNFPYALVNAGYIDKPSYSIYLGGDNGEKGLVLFGGIDKKKYKGELKTYPIDDNYYAAIELKTMTYEEKTYTANRPALLDTGTSWNFLPEEVVFEIADALGAPKCKNCDKQISCDQPTDKYFTFGFGDQNITLSYADLVVIPFPDEPDYCLLGLDVAGEKSDLILGDVFLRKVYTYYDYEENTISLAPVVDTEESEIVNA